METLCLTIYLHEKRKHKGELLYEWLLAQAQKLNLPGGSAFRSIAGFGKHGIVQEEHFYELASSLPIALVFYLTSDEKKHLMNRIKEEKLDLFIISYPVHKEG